MIGIFPEVVCDGFKVDDVVLFGYAVGNIFVWSFMDPCNSLKCMPRYPLSGI